MAIRSRLPLRCSAPLLPPQYYGASTRIANVAGKTASACATNITMVNLTTRPMHVVRAARLQWSLPQALHRFAAAPPAPGRALGDEVVRLRQPSTPQAVAAGQITLVEGLLKHGCLVNEAGIMGETPLHLAAAHGDVETAKMLLVRTGEGRGGRFVFARGETCLSVMCERRWRIHRLSVRPPLCLSATTTGKRRGRERSRCGESTVHAANAHKSPDITSSRSR